MLALPELHCEFNRTPNVPYLDIKAAFDSVDRRALWKALRSTGLPDDQFTPNVSVQFCLGHGPSAVKTRLSAPVSLYCVTIYDFRFYGICHRSRKSKFGAITSATWCPLTTLPSSWNPPSMLSAAYPVSMRHHSHLTFESCDEKPSLKTVAPVLNHRQHWSVKASRHLIVSLALEAFSPQTVTVVQRVTNRRTLYRYDVLSRVFVV